MDLVRNGFQTLALPVDFNQFQTDVDDVKFVVNYDFPSNTEDYVHRIGRTGRSNNKGTSYTFFTETHAARVDELINILKESNQVRTFLETFTSSYAKDHMLSNYLVCRSRAYAVQEGISREQHTAVRII